MLSPVRDPPESVPISVQVTGIAPSGTSSSRTVDALLRGHQLCNRFAIRGIPSVPSEAGAVRVLYKR